MTTSTEHDFRDEVRAFLDEQLTADLRAAGRATVGTHSDIQASREWHRRLYDRGWIAPAWPAEHGGTGWSPRQRLIFDRECALNDAPVLFAGGLRNVGPLLIAMGSPEQRSRYLPRILRGEDLWCQGYSETTAGSDLAALRTGGRRAGSGHYCVNGRKIWTTGADLATHMFALVRTATAGKPQQGITFLLIDMQTPGIHIRPVSTISGEAEFNEVIFDDVLVPVCNRVGAEDDGWTVAKTLMYYARSSNTTCALLRRAFRRTQELLEKSSGVPQATLRRLHEAEMRLSVLERLEYDATARDAGTAMEFSASAMKIQATELHQRITEIALEIAGYPAFEARDAADPTANSPFAHASAKYFATRAASIYSGTNEIHRNILGKHLLGRGG